MATYEVQIMRDGRWITEVILEEEAPALNTAKKALSGGGDAQGARVIMERTIAGIKTTERVIFEETREVKEKTAVTISPIDHAPWCDEADALYELPARMTVTRLLRSYLDRNMLLPSELLYAFRPLQRLQDHDSNIYPAAVDRVATLQATAREDGNIKERRDALYAMIDEVGRRSRRAEGEKIMRGTGLDDLAEAFRKAERAAFDPKEQHFLVKAAIGRDLAGHRSWLGKTEALVNAITDDLPHDTLDMLDEFLADCMGVGEVVQEILGDRPNLGNAILTMIDLVEGKGLPQSDRASELAQAIAQLFESGRLPACRTVMIDRIYREMGGKSPLSRNNPSQEHDVFETVARRVITDRGVFGDDKTAVAITRRYSRRLQQGGDAGWRHSIVGVSSMLMDGARRLHYLSALSHAAEMEPYRSTILEMIVDTIKTSRTVDDLASGSAPAKKLAAVTSVQKALAHTTALPEVLQQRLFSHFDTMLAKYVEDAQIIERLDHPDDSLRQRAERLVSFCGSGVLMEGKALNVARERVLGHLKRADFMTEFLSDVPPERQEEELRQFHTRLARAGFGGSA